MFAVLSQDSAHKIPSESKLFIVIFSVMIKNAQERQYLLYYMQKPYSFISKATTLFKIIFENHERYVKSAVKISGEIIS